MCVFTPADVHAAALLSFSIEVAFDNGHQCTISLVPSIIDPKLTTSCRVTVIAIQSEVKRARKSAMKTTNQYNVIIAYIGFLYCSPSHVASTSPFRYIQLLTWLIKIYNIYIPVMSHIAHTSQWKVSVYIMLLE